MSTPDYFAFLSGAPLTPEAVTDSPDYFSFMGGGKPPAPAADQGEFSKGLSFGVRQTKALGHAAAAVGGDIFGADQFAIEQLTKYQQLMQEAEQFKPEVASIEEIDSPGKFVSWAAAMLGQQMPIIATTVVTGGAGSIIGALVGRKIVAGTTADFLAKKAAQWGLEKGVPAATSRIGAVTGAFAGATGLETGATYGEQAEALANTGEPLQPGTALLAGTAKGALEIITPISVARLFGLKLPFAEQFAGRITEAMAEKGLLARMAIGGGTIMATEATTEGLQEVIDVAARKFVDDNYDALGPEAASRILNSAAAGGLVGVVFGGAGGIRRQEPVAKPAAEGEQQQPPSVTPPAPLGTEQGISEAELPTILPEPVPEGTAEPSAVATPQAEPRAKTGLVQPIILFEDGRSRVVDPDAETAREVMLTETLVPPESRTPAQQILMQQEEQRRAQLFHRYFELPKEASPQLARLVDLRGQILTAPQFRGESGDLLPAAQKKLDAVSNAIDTLAQQEQIDITPQSRLTAVENQRYAFLQEKERTEGLNEREYAQLEKLIAKAEGEQAAVRVPPTPEKVAELESEIEQGLKQERPLYSSPVQRPQERLGITRERFEQLIAPVRLQLEGNVVVLNNALELPDDLAFLRAPGHYVEALYVPKTDTTYFILENLSESRAPKVYLHEVNAHHGLRKGLPAKVFDEIIRLIKKTRPEVVKSYLENRQIPANWTQEDATNIAAEEYVAKIAEDGTDQPLLRKIIAIIRRWLRGVFPDMQITDDEIRLWLADIRKTLAAPVTDRNPAPSAKAEQFFSLQDADDSSLPEGYTMRIMARLPQKEWITRQQVEQGMKAIGANKAEHAVVNEVLALPYMGEKFRRRTFEMELRQRIVPLETEDLTGFGAYDDYGLDRIGIENEDEAVAYKRSRLFIAPFTTPPEANHFNRENYVGHTRSFDLGNARHIVEVQSDMEKLRPLDAKQQVALENLVEGYERIYKEGLALLKQARLEGTGTLPEQFMPQAKQIVQMVRELTGRSTLHPDLQVNMNMLERAVNAADEMAADAKLRLFASRDAKLLQENVQWQRIAPAIYKTMLRRETRLAAQQGMEKVRLASVKTLGLVEGWFDAREVSAMQHGEQRLNFVSMPEKQILEFLDMKGKLSRNIQTGVQQFDVIGIAKRHADLLSWAKREFGAVEVQAEGQSWIEWNAKDGDEIAFASDAAQDAHDLGDLLDADTRETSKSLDKWNKLWQIKLLTRVLTPLQLAKKYALEPINRYITTVDNWAQTKMNIIQPADGVVERWQLLGKNAANGLANAIFEMSARSDELQRRLTQSEEAEILKRFKVEGEALSVYGEITKSFNDVLVRLEKGLKYNAARETLGSKKLAQEFLDRWEQTKEDQKGRQDFIMKLTLSPNISVRLVSRIHQIEKDLAQLRNRNYFPYTRFGKYTVSMRAMEDGQKYEGKDYKAGQVAAFWTFETKAARDSFLKETEIKQLENKGFEISASQMRDEQFAFLGMPPSLMDAIANEVEMSNEQRDQLKEFFIKHSPGRAFLRHLIRRKGIKGFSMDAMRVYATYMMNAANHLARVEHYADMDQSLKDLYELRRSFEARSGDSTGLVEIYNAFQRHRKYIMNPGNDLAKLRAMGFMWYLGFNPKSALVNLTQTPMVTYPYLANKYGDAAAVREIARAIKDAAAFTTGRTNLDPVIDQLYARALKEGFVDESLATELAGISEGGTLSRILPETNTGRLVNQVSYYGAWLFRHAEKFTRAIAFVSAVRLELARSGDQEQAYQAGKDAVRSTLFEYAKWNRPEFMRGKKSVFFLFWTFMQHMTFISFGGEGARTAMRIWVMLLLMAGLQGLPWAENLLSLLDFGSTTMKKALGMKNPYTDLRTEIRELLSTITDQPDLVMHGLSRYWGLGPLHVLELAGVPVPRVDTSASLSFGRVIPGLDELLGPERNPDTKFGRSIAEIMGPVFGMPYVLWKAYEDDDPNSWKRWERAMPTAMKSASRSARWLVHGEETFRGGGTVAEFDPHDTEQQAEAIAQAFGFSPTRINQRYELRAAQQQIKEYLMTKRSLLLSEYAHAKMLRDPEAVRDVREAIRDFNRNAPDYKLHITPKVLERSYDQRVKAAKLRSQGRPAELSLRKTFAAVASAYPEVDL